MENNLIIVRQLPVIEEQLASIKAQIEERVAAALAMPCTEETVKQVKTARAELSRGFQELETRRREVKGKVLSPYEQFERVYKSCVTEVFKPADDQLKAKIDEVENGLKDQKRAEAAAYFDEYRAAKGIDFLTFEQTGIAVTLSVSLKKLKEQAKAALDKTADDLALIGTQEHAEEILFEYKRTLNVSQSITSVTARHKAIEEERQRAAQAREAARARQEAAQKVEQAIMDSPATTPASSFTAPPIAAPAASPASDSPGEVFEVVFAVRGTLDGLRAVKQFLTDGGYDYEQR